MSSQETFRERTLATRYQPRQQLPPEFPDILKEYAREVLRAQPDDILAWSASYFKRLALETDPLQPKQPPPGHYAPVVDNEDRAILTQKLVKMMAAADPAGVGVLSVDAVRKVLEDSFQLSAEQSLYAVSSPLVNFGADGMIEYEVFCRDSARTVQWLLETGYEFRVGAGQDDGAEPTVHGLNRADIEGNLFRMFALLDEGETGMLSYADYRNALINAPYHFTRRDITVLCIACEQSSDEKVDYKAERGRWFDLLQLAEQFELLDLESSDEGRSDM